jgi:hypothetical protein
MASPTPETPHLPHDAAPIPHPAQPTREALPPFRVEIKQPRLERVRRIVERVTTRRSPEVAEYKAVSKLLDRAGFSFKNEDKNFLIPRLTRSMAGNEALYREVMRDFANGNSLQQEDAFQLAALMEFYAERVDVDVQNEHFIRAAELDQSHASKVNRLEEAFNLLSPDEQDVVQRYIYVQETFLRRVLSSQKDFSPITFQNPSIPRSPDTEPLNQGEEVTVLESGSDADMVLNADSVYNAIINGGAAGAMGEVPRIIFGGQEVITDQQFEALQTFINDSEDFSTRQKKLILNSEIWNLFKQRTAERVAKFRKPEAVAGPPQESGIESALRAILEGSDDEMVDLLTPLSDSEREKMKSLLQAMISNFAKLESALNLMNSDVLPPPTAPVPQPVGGVNLRLDNLQSTPDASPITGVTLGDNLTIPVVPEIEE